MKKLVIELPDQATQQRIEELLILWSAELVLAGLSPEVIRVRRQRPWDRYSSGLRESFCSS